MSAKDNAYGKRWENRRAREAEMAELGLDWPGYLIYKARQWHEMYGPLTAADWNLTYCRNAKRYAPSSKVAPERLAEVEARHEEVLWPTPSTVLKHFPTWRIFLERAGLPSVERGQRHPERVDEWKQHMSESRSA